MITQWIILLLLSHTLTSALPASDSSSDDENLGICTTYADCSSHGHLLSTWLQGNITSPTTLDRTDGTAMFTQHYTYETKNPDPADDTIDEISSYLETRGLPSINSDPNYTTRIISSKPPTAIIAWWNTVFRNQDYEAAYKNVLNRHAGVIIATNNDRAEDEAAQKLNWSEIMYQAWKATKGGVACWRIYGW
ncbi:MAG: hypothetical protein Q9221_009052 [Calogaya cf. arnoldii]